MKGGSQLFPSVFLNLCLVIQTDMFGSDNDDDDDDDK